MFSSNHSRFYGSIAIAVILASVFAVALNVQLNARARNEETPGAPVVTDPIPIDGATDVKITITELVFTIEDPENDPMDYAVTTSPDIGSDSGTGLYNGTCTVSVSGPGLGATYTWYVEVTDGTHWTNKTFVFTTRLAISVSDPEPADGGKRGSLNPELSANIKGVGYPMNISFSTNASGLWQEIQSYTNVADGGYSVKPRDMTRRGETYYWGVGVADGTTTVSRTYSFDLVYYFNASLEVIANATCSKFGYIKPGWEKGKFFVTVQEYPTPRKWAAYDIDQGWYETFQVLYPLRSDWDHIPFFGYWDGMYHQIAHNESIGLGWYSIDSPTFEGFSTKDISDRYEFGSVEDFNVVGSAYTFNNTYAWILAGDGGYVKYWPWDKAAGWGSAVSVCSGAGWMSTVGLLRHDRITWYLYFTDGSNNLKYVKTTDSGKTWGTPVNTGIIARDLRSHISFAKYGNNYYIFLAQGSDSVVYYSTDGVNWGNRQVIVSGMNMMLHGTLLHQSALISTMNPSDEYQNFNDNQYGAITIIPELLSYPGKPSDPFPLDETALHSGSVTTDLKVLVHGDQTYDVAFYWENGTFIGEDKLLREGDNATVRVSGLNDDLEYRWYAIARGATLEYTSSEPATTSDEQRTDTYSFTVGTRPKLEMNPSDVTCRKHLEAFTLEINITDAVNVTDFTFEIGYGAPLLEYVGMEWGSFLDGTGQIDYAAPGVVRGHIDTSTTVNGSGWLLNISFHANKTLIWKDCPGWTNKLEGEIWFHQANLSRSAGPDLRYEQGGLQEIGVTNVKYTFVPIQGDVNNDGTVGIFDIRTVAAYYNVREGDTLWSTASVYDLNGDDTIDIFDLVAICVNHGFTYP